MRSTALGLVGVLIALGNTLAEDRRANAEAPWSAYWQESSDSEALCRGSYTIPSPDSHQDEVWMTLSGKALEYEPDVGAEITGGVRVGFGARVFEAESVTTPGGMSVLEFEERVRYFEPGAAIWGDRATYNANTASVSLESLAFLLEDRVFSPEAESLLPPVRGESRRIQLSEARVLVEDAWFTRCEPQSRGWEVSAKTLSIDGTDAFATVTNARLEVADLPVLYLPWMKFPVTSERQTGWLYPDLRYEGERGALIRLPFYWNLAPNRDFVLIPGFEGRRGGSLGVEYRHATAHSSNRMIAHFLSDDEEFKDDYPGETGDRYLVRANHSGQFGRLSTHANLTLLSDRRMHRERYDELGSSHTRWGAPSVTNEGSILYQRDAWRVGIEMEQYRIDWNPNPDAYRTLPRVFFAGHKRFASGLRTSLHSSWTRFTNDITERDFGEVTRLHSDLLVELPMRKPWGGVTASLGGGYVGFDLHEARPGQTAWRDEGTSNLGTAFFNLDGSLRFERRFGSLRMSLEPRALYSYRQSDELPGVPLFDSVLNEYSLSQLFAGRSYAGIDRYADTHQISLGLRSRMWSLASGRRLFELEAGLIRSLEGDGVLLARLDSKQNISPLAIRARSWLSDQLRIESALIWQRDGDRWFERGLWASYRTSEHLVLRIGYRMRRYGEVFEQGEAALDMPVSERVRVFALYQHDFSQAKLLMGVLGASYTHCCFAVDFGLRRLLRRPDNMIEEPPYHSNAVYLRILFRGFAGVGDSMAPIFSQLRGYRDGW